MANLIQSLDVIDRLPSELQAALEADPFFADIPVIVSDAGNVKAELARKQAIATTKSGRRGAAVIVLQIEAEDEYPEQGFGPLTLRPAFQVIENVEWNHDTNGTKKSHRRIARKIVQIIKPLALIGVVTEFVPDKPCIEAVDLEPELGPLIKASQVNFRTFESDSEVVSQVATPQFAAYPDSTPKFQMTCATAGAAVWWSSDDSFPAPGRAGSALYAAPIGIPAAGITVRAAAYKTGMVGSQVNRALIEVT
jgi:hypothetical protein